MPETRMWYFAPFHLDLRAERLWQGTEPVRLTAKAFAVLCYLVEHAGQLVTKDALFAAVWASAYVSEAALAVCIGEIRRALGDAAQTPQYLETVRGRGYRFVAPVTVPSSSPEPAAAERPEPMVSTRPGLLVGREAELTELQQRWAQARQGVRQMVFVTGEAGIGKTTLVDAFVAQVVVTEKVWHSRGQCIEQHGMGEAYLPLLEALGRLGRATNGGRLIALLHQQAPSWLVHLPALVPPETFEALQRRAGGTTRERMLRELAEAVEVLTVEQPLVLVLEDLHWSDGATLDWLAYVARRREAARLLVLGTYRPVEAIVRMHAVHTVTQELRLHGQATEVILSYLPATGVATYLAQRFGENALPVGLSNVLHQRTDGNPLFLVTVVDDLVQQEVIRHETTGWTLVGGLEAAVRGVPESLRQFMEQQFAQLSPAEQVLLEAASVAGTEFVAAAAAAGVDATGEAVEMQYATLARRGQFIQAHGSVDWPDGTITARYGFLHALYREFLYDRVHTSQRVRLHRQIGLRLETGYGPQVQKVAVELAEHFVRGRDTKRAVQYLQMAGAQAMQRSAHQEAIRHLNQALELLATLPDTPERAEHELAVQVALGPALMASKGYTAPNVVRTYTRALTLCQYSGESPHRFAVLRGLRRVYAGRAEMAQAQAMGEALLDLAERSHNAGYLLEAHLGVGTNEFLMGALESARTHLEAALALYHPEHHRTHIMLYGHEPGVISLATLSWVLWLVGYPDQALQRSQAAIALAQQALHPSSLNFALLWATRLAQYRREVQTTQARAETTSTLAREAGLGVAVATILRGWALAMQGQGAEGVAQIRQGMATQHALGEMLSQPYFAALLAEAYLQTGQPNAGLSVVVEALAAVCTYDHRYYAAELYRLQGELLRCQARPVLAQAEACFQQALVVARQQQAKSLELRAAVSLARLWQQQGKRAAARELLAPIYGWFTEGFDTADLQESKVLLDTLA
jgi:DNA-binding winged helix-turn-helix (wHTH) protein/predicted ATPase